MLDEKAMATGEDSSVGAFLNTPEKSRFKRVDCTHRKFRRSQRNACNTCKRYKDQRQYRLPTMCL